MSCVLAWAILVQQADVDAILAKADALLEEAKTAYEHARSTSTVTAFVEAGFKLEEARIKYLVIQEIGQGEKQKLAADRLRAVNQLNKLVNDGKVAVMNPPAAKPADPAAPDPGPAPPPVDVSKRAAVPDTAKQKEAEKLVRDLFKQEYAKKSPTDRKALARQLLDQAAKSVDDPAGCWVLCREAEDVALQIGDVEAAVRAAERRAEMFDIDVLPSRGAVLTAAAKTVKSPEDAGTLAEALLKHVDELVRADQYEPADKSATAAVAHAKKANDPGLAARASTRAKEVAEMKSLFQAQKSVLEKLAKDGEDPGANLEMGKFLCYVKGSWDLGLRFMVKGSDPALKALAEKELAYPEPIAERLAVADGWYDVGEKEKSPLRKSQLLAHARVLYEALLPSTTALVRAKVEKRLDGMAADGPPTSVVDLLRLIDPKRDAFLGEWSFDGKALVCGQPIMCARLQVPYEPPEEYDLTVVAERKEGSHVLYVGLAGPAFQGYVGIDDWRGTVTGIARVDGKTTKDNETAVPGKIFTNDRPCTIVCAVRKDSITVTIDGRKVTSFKGGMTRISNDPLLAMPNRRALWIGATDCRFVISKIQLKPLSTPGKATR